MYADCHVAALVRLKARRHGNRETDVSAEFRKPVCRGGVLGLRFYI